MGFIRHAFQQRQHMLLENYELYHYKDYSERLVSLHFHDFYECFFLLGGGLDYQIDNQSFRLDAGDILLIGPNQLHRPIIADENREYERIVLWLSRAYVSALSTAETDLSRCFSVEQRTAYRFPRETQEGLRAQFFRLFEEDGAQRFGGDVLKNAYMTDLLVTLNRVCDTARAQGDEPARMNETSLAARVSDYLDAHLESGVTLNDVAQSMYLSKFYLTRAFRAQTGTTIYGMLQKKRMIKARNLLYAGIEPQSAAEKCGFSDYSGFYKAFRAEYGVSPRAYARLAPRI